MYGSIVLFVIVLHFFLLKPSAHFVFFFGGPILLDDKDNSFDIDIDDGQNVKSDTRDTHFVPDDSVDTASLSPVVFLFAVIVP